MTTTCFPKKHVKLNCKENIGSLNLDITLALMKQYILIQDSNIDLELNLIDQSSPQSYPLALHCIAPMQASKRGLTIGDKYDNFIMTLIYLTQLKSGLNHILSHFFYNPPHFTISLTSLICTKKTLIFSPNWTYF